jgi:hypothetical protein
MRGNPAAFGTWTVPDGSPVRNNGVQTNANSRPVYTLSGLQFDGVDDQFSFPQSATTAGTFAAWVKTTNDTLRAIFGATKALTTGNNFYIIFLGNGAISAFANELISVVANTGAGVGTRAAYCTLARTELLDGNWHHVAVTQTGSALKIYLDGASKNITISDGSVTNKWTADVTADTFCIGGYIYDGAQGSENIAGTVRGARTWYVALTADQISNLYKAGSKGTP